MLTETISNRKFASPPSQPCSGRSNVVASPVAVGHTIHLVGTAPPGGHWPGRPRLNQPLSAPPGDVRQAHQGFYDVQQPDVQPRTNGRGFFTTDDMGEFWFRTIVPSYYPIPTDGPVGELLKATGRHASARPTSTSSSPPPATAT